MAVPKVFISYSHEDEARKEQPSVISGCWSDGALLTSGTPARNSETMVVADFLVVG